jgi:hypothetical protein
MAKSAQSRANWQRPGSPIGRKGPRKAHPRYTRNNYKGWRADDVRELRRLAKGNTPTRVIGLKLGRTEIAVRGKAQREGISLRPANRSPYNRRRRPAR